MNKDQHEAHPSVHLSLPPSRFPNYPRTFVWPTSSASPLTPPNSLLLPAILQSLCLPSTSQSANTFIHLNPSQASLSPGTSVRMVFLKYLNILHLGIGFDSILSNLNLHIGWKSFLSCVFGGKWRYLLQLSTITKQISTVVCKKRFNLILI